MDKGKEGGGLGSCCHSSESSFESEDKRVVQFGKEWSEYEREKGSGHEASARHLTITKRSGSGQKSRDSDSADMLPLHKVEVRGVLWVLSNALNRLRDQRSDSRGE